MRVTSAMKTYTKILSVSMASLSLVVSYPVGSQQIYHAYPDKREPLTVLKQSLLMTAETKATPLHAICRLGHAASTYRLIPEAGQLASMQKSLETTSEKMQINFDLVNSIVEKDAASNGTRVQKLIDHMGKKLAVNEKHLSSRKKLIYATLAMFRCKTTQLRDLTQDKAIIEDLRRNPNLPTRNTQKRCVKSPCW